MSAELAGPAHWQAVLDAYQAVRRLPAIVAAVHDLSAGGCSRPVWRGTAGEADQAAQFRIGSITKTLVAIAVMQARDAGELGLDDELGKFVPETTLGSRTLRQLLSHTAGLPSESAGSWWERSPGVTFGALVEANDGQRQPFGPGETFHYSNLGFALLGEVLARVYGTDWFEVVRGGVLEPLGMERTTLLPVPPHAQGYSVDHFAGTLTREPHQDTGAMAPAGQIWSTIEDLGRLLGFLACGAEGVLADATREEMRTPVQPGYGLGVMNFESNVGRLLGHSGSMPGFQAVALFAPEAGAGLVALTNATTGFSGNELTARMLGTVTPPVIEPWRPSTSVPGWAVELLGLWFWGNSAFTCHWNNDRLELRDLARGCVAEEFVQVGEEILGHLGYHRGELLQVRRLGDGSVLNLECATFVYTRVPYDPRVVIPGGHPSPHREPGAGATLLDLDAHGDALA